MNFIRNPITCKKKAYELSNVRKLTLFRRRDNNIKNYCKKEKYLIFSQENKNSQILEIFFCFFLIKGLSK